MNAEPDQKHFEKTISDVSIVNMLRLKKLEKIIEDLSSTVRNLTKKVEAYEMKEKLENTRVSVRACEEHDKTFEQLRKCELMKAMFTTEISTSSIHIWWDHKCDPFDCNCKYIYFIRKFNDLLEKFNRYIIDPKTFIRYITPSCQYLQKRCTTEQNTNVITDEKINIIKAILIDENINEIRKLINTAIYNLENMLW